MNDVTRSPAVAITWEHHRRTEGLCEALELPLFVLTDEGARIVRYLRLAYRTLRLIAARRPSVVLVQNPSLMLAITAWALRALLWKFELIVDAHNEAVQPYINTRWPVPQIARWIMRQADLTIVTNRQLAREVIQYGGRPYVLPDPLPAIPLVAGTPTDTGVVEIMVIATYAPDEPIRQIVAAAASLGSRFRFSFTGNENRFPKDLKRELPPNVRLMGFLPEANYWALMARSHLILDLTLMPNCLVCGAYEALAMGRAMILSESESGRELFGAVATFADLISDGIAKAVQEAHRNLDVVQARMESTRAIYRDRWRRDAESLRQRIHGTDA